MTEFSDTIQPSRKRTGVILCKCGGKISNVIDMAALSAQAGAMPGVTCVVSEAYPCNKDGLERMQRAIREQQLERVVIAGCTPRLVEKLFRTAAGEAGLPANALDIADIREHCAYVHSDDPQAALAKAADQIAMSVCHLLESDSPGAYQQPVTRHATVIGSDLTGLTAALALAEARIPVTIIEAQNALGSDLQYLQERGRELLAQRAVEVGNHPNIQVLTRARVQDVSGQPGRYLLKLAVGKNPMQIETGAILVAQDAVPEPLTSEHWIDHSRLRSQVEFAIELEQAQQRQALDLQDIVFILCPQGSQSGGCARVCCAAGIRQAILARELNPDATVTILFRDLYLDGGNGSGKQLVHQAREAGVTFFRYRQDHPPRIEEKAIHLEDALTESALELPYDRVVLTTPITAAPGNRPVAARLNLPQDEAGFIVAPRYRLRPGRHPAEGIFVSGSAHQPLETTRVLYEAYLTATRIRRFLEQEVIEVRLPVAEVAAELCTGCANCVHVCPTHAVTLQPRQSVLSLAVVDPLRCIGCGNCVVACPVKAISLPTWDDSAILAQITAALQAKEQDTAAERILALACEWSAYAAADVAGARHKDYPAEVRILRLNCSARFDPFHVLWAFLNGAEGVFLGACPPGECHYGNGNLYARERVEALKKMLVEYGIDPDRLAFEFIPGDDGEKFARAMREFKARLVAKRPKSIPVVAKPG